MMVALLASVSAGIFAAHILDALHMGRQRSGIGASYVEIQMITTDALQTAKLPQSPTQNPRSVCCRSTTVSRARSDVPECKQSGAALPKAAITSKDIAPSILSSGGWVDSVI
jgi:hypothetical protein